MELRIESEIKSLIPPLSQDELSQLESNILSDGCREALVTWEGILLDGHNRLFICQKHNLPYRTEIINLTDIDAAKIWVEENQLGRRNLTDDQRTAVAHRLQQRKVEIAKRERAKRARYAVEERNPVSPEKKADLVVTPSPKSEPKERTRAAVAKSHKVSERKLRAIAQVAKSKPEMVQQIADGKLTVAQAIREVKREAIINNLENIKAKKSKELSGVYDVLVIDPPWPMQKIERDERPNQSEFDYPTMSEEELFNLKIPYAEDCHIWLWTTQKFLPMAIRLLEIWRLKYVCTFIWHKPGGFQPIGLPQYNCEFALYARKGNPQFIDTKAFFTCFNAPRGKHSEKPEDFYEMVRRVTAGRRMDMFNRRNIEGFEGWGKEV